MPAPRQRWGVMIGLNALLVVLVLLGFRISFGWGGTRVLQYYTELSNLLGGLMAAVVLVSALRAWLRGELTLPRWVQVLKYVSVCCLMVTFLVVVLVLGPQSGSVEGYLANFTKGSVLYSHLLSPVLAVVTWIFVDAKDRLLRRDVIYALMATVLYAGVMVVLNLQRKVRGPYFFLDVTRQPIGQSVIWSVVILGLNLLIAYGLWQWGRKKQKFS